MDNNKLFQELLAANPPEYNIGDQVMVSGGRATIIGRVWSERLKGWKYTVRPFGLTMIMDVLENANMIKYG